MKCPHCGADTSGKFCEYCGSELPYSGPQVQNTYKTENVTHHVTNVYYVNSTAETLPVDFPSVSSPAAAVPKPQPVIQPVSSAPAATVSPKSKNAAVLLWYFLGIFGGHLFYAGRWKMGLLYLFTGGIGSIGWIIDFFSLAFNKFKDSKNLPIKGRAKSAWLVVLICTVLVFVIYIAGNS